MIKHEKTVPKTPQQNGLAERMIHTICEKMWTILSYVKLPKKIWDEVVRTATDINSLSPTYALKMDVPEHV